MPEAAVGIRSGFGRFSAIHDEHPNSPRTTGIIVIAKTQLAKVLVQAGGGDLLSNEHFAVDRPAVFYGERRGDTAEQSTTGPQAQLTTERSGQGDVDAPSSGGIPSNKRQVSSLRVRDLALRADVQDKRTMR